MYHGQLRWRVQRYYVYAVCDRQLLSIFRLLELRFMCRWRFHRRGQRNCMRGVRGRQLLCFFGEYLVFVVPCGQLCGS